MAENKVDLLLVGKADFSDVTKKLMQLKQSIASVNKESSSLSNVSINTQQISNAQKQFVQTVSAIKGVRVEMVGLSDSAEHLNTKLLENKRSMGDMFKTYRQGKNSMVGDMEQIAQYQAKLHQSMVVPSAVQNGQAAVVTNFAELGKQTLVNGMRLKAYNTEMLNLSNRMINFGKNTQWAGRQLTVGLTVPLLAAGGAITAMFYQVDQSMRKLLSVYGVGGSAHGAFSGMLPSQQELNNVKNGIMQVSQQMAAMYGQTSAQTVGIAADLAAAGYTQQQLLSLTKTVTDAMVLGQTDQQSAIKATIALQTTYALTTSQTGDALNFFSAAQAATSTSMKDLIDAIPRVGPVMKNLGGSYKDTVAFLVAMKEGGVAAGEGANALKNSLQRIIAPTKSASEQMKQFGVNLDDISKSGSPVVMIEKIQAALQKLDPVTRQVAITDLFGKFQASRMTALLDNFNRTGTQSAKVMEMMALSAEELAGIQKHQVDTLMQSPSMKFASAIESLKQQLLPIGEKLLELATPIVNGITWIISAFQKIGPLKYLLAGGLGIAAIAGPIIMFVGLISNLGGQLFKIVNQMRMFREGFSAGGGLAKPFKALAAGIMGTQNYLEEFDAAQYASERASADLALSLQDQSKSWIELTAAMEQYRAALEGIRDIAGNGGIIPPAPDGGGSSGGGYPRVPTSGPMSPAGIVGDASRPVQIEVASIVLKNHRGLMGFENDEDLTISHLRPTLGTQGGSNVLNNPNYDPRSNAQGTFGVFPGYFAGRGGAQLNQALGEQPLPVIPTGMNGKDFVKQILQELGVKNITDQMVQTAMKELSIENIGGNEAGKLSMLRGVSAIQGSPADMAAFKKIGSAPGATSADVEKFFAEKLGTQWETIKQEAAQQILHLYEIAQQETAQAVQQGWVAPQNAGQEMGLIGGRFSELISEQINKIVATYSEELVKSLTIDTTKETNLNEGMKRKVMARLVNAGASTQAMMNPLLDALESLIQQTRKLTGGLTSEAKMATAQIAAMGARGAIEGVSTIGKARTIPTAVIPIEPTPLATGGKVYGPGGPKDDLIPALLSNGEYVIKADSVGHYGSSFLDSVNAKKLANGGLAGGGIARLHDGSKKFKKQIESVHGKHKHDPNDDSIIHFDDGLTVVRTGGVAGGKLNPAETEMRDRQARSVFEDPDAAELALRYLNIQDVQAATQDRYSPLYPNATHTVGDVTKKEQHIYDRFSQPSALTGMTSVENQLMVILETNDTIRRYASILAAEMGDPTLIDRIFANKERGSAVNPITQSDLELLGKIGDHIALRSRVDPRLEAKINETLMRNAKESKLGSQFNLDYMLAGLGLSGIRGRQLERQGLSQVSTFESDSAPRLAKGGWAKFFGGGIARYSGENGESGEVLPPHLRRQIPTSLPGGYQTGWNAPTRGVWDDPNNPDFIPGQLPMFMTIQEMLDFAQYNSGDIKPGESRRPESLWERKLSEAEKRGLVESIREKGFLGAIGMRVPPLGREKMVQAGRNKWVPESPEFLTHHRMAALMSLFPAGDNTMFPVDFTEASKDDQRKKKMPVSAWRGIVDSSVAGVGEWGDKKKGLFRGGIARFADATPATGGGFSATAVEAMMKARAAATVSPTREYSQDEIEAFLSSPDSPFIPGPNADLFFSSRTAGEAGRMPRETIDQMIRAGLIAYRKVEPQPGETGKMIGAITPEETWLVESSLQHAGGMKEGWDKVTGPEDPLPDVAAQRLREYLASFPGDTMRLWRSITLDPDNAKLAPGHYGMLPFEALDEAGQRFLSFSTKMRVPEQFATPNDMGMTPRVIEVDVPKNAVVAIDKVNYDTIYSEQEVLVDKLKLANLPIRYINPTGMASTEFTGVQTEPGTSIDQSVGDPFIARFAPTAVASDRINDRLIDDIVSRGARIGTSNPMAISYVTGYQTASDQPRQIGEQPDVERDAALYGVTQAELQLGKSYLESTYEMPLPQLKTQKNASVIQAVQDRIAKQTPPGTPRPPTAYIVNRDTRLLDIVAKGMGVRGPSGHQVHVTDTPGRLSSMWSPELLAGRGVNGQLNIPETLKCGGCGKIFEGVYSQSLDLKYKKVYCPACKATIDKLNYPQEINDAPPIVDETGILAGGGLIGKFAQGGILGLATGTENSGDHKGPIGGYSQAALDGLYESVGRVAPTFPETMTEEQLKEYLASPGHLGDQWTEEGHPLISDPEDFRVWQALVPGVLPPGVKSWRESPSAGLAVLSEKIRRMMLPEVTYPPDSRGAYQVGPSRIDVDNDFNKEWDLGTRNFYKNGGIARFAYGGKAFGPGGPKDDLIPAMISNGEYVVNADAVGHYGPGFMDAINAKKLAGGGIAGFASGTIEGNGERFNPMMQQLGYSLPSLMQMMMAPGAGLGTVFPELISQIAQFSQIFRSTGEAAEPVREKLSEMGNRELARTQMVFGDLADSGKEFKDNVKGMWGKLKDKFGKKSPNDEADAVKEIKDQVSQQKPDVEKKSYADKIKDTINTGSSEGVDEPEGSGPELDSDGNPASPQEGKPKGKFRRGLSKVGGAFRGGGGMMIGSMASMGANVISANMTEGAGGPTGGSEALSYGANAFGALAMFGPQVALPAAAAAAALGFALGKQAEATRAVEKSVTDVITKHAGFRESIGGSAEVLQTLGLESKKLTTMNFAGLSNQTGNMTQKINELADAMKNGSEQSKALIEYTKNSSPETQKKAMQDSYNSVIQAGGKKEDAAAAAAALAKNAGISSFTSSTIIDQLNKQTQGYGGKGQKSLAYAGFMDQMGNASKVDVKGAQASIGTGELERLKLTANGSYLSQMSNAGGVMGGVGTVLNGYQNMAEGISGFGLDRLGIGGDIKTGIQSYVSGNWLQAAISNQAAGRGLFDITGSNPLLGAGGTGQQHDWVKELNLKDVGPNFNISTIANKWGDVKGAATGLSGKDIMSSGNQDLINAAKMAGVTAETNITATTAAFEKLSAVMASGALTDPNTSKDLLTNIQSFVESGQDFKAQFIEPISSGMASLRGNELSGFLTNAMNKIQSLGGDIGDVVSGIAEKMGPEFKKFAPEFSKDKEAAVRYLQALALVRNMHFDSEKAAAKAAQAMAQDKSGTLRRAAGDQSNFEAASAMATDKLVSGVDVAAQAKAIQDRVAARQKTLDKQFKADQRAASDAFKATQKSDNEKIKGIQKEIDARQKLWDAKQKGIEQDRTLNNLQNDIYKARASGDILAIASAQGAYNTELQKQQEINAKDAADQKNKDSIQGTQDKMAADQEAYDARMQAMQDRYDKEMERLQAESQQASDMAANAETLGAKNKDLITEQMKAINEFAMKPGETEAQFQKDIAPVVAKIAKETGRTPENIRKTLEATHRAGQKWASGAEPFIYKGDGSIEQIGMKGSKIVVDPNGDLVLKLNGKKDTVIKTGVTATTTTTTTGGATSSPGAGPDVQSRADGGHIRGPGTETSDSIPAMLSDGEYVVKARSVKQYGTGFMDAINNGRLDGGGFAEGGPIRGYATGGLISKNNKKSDGEEFGTGLPMSATDKKKVKNKAPRNEAAPPSGAVAGPTGNPGAQTTGDAIAALAKTYAGVPYVDSAKIDGEATPSTGWDCSTFVKYVYKQFGMNDVVGYTYDQLSDSKFKFVQHGQEAPGDTLYYMRNGNHHVRIYTGGDSAMGAESPSSGTHATTAWGDGWSSSNYGVNSNADGSRRRWDGNFTGQMPTGGTGSGAGGTIASAPTYAQPQMIDLTEKSRMSILGLTSIFGSSINSKLALPMNIGKAKQNSAGAASNGSVSGTGNLATGDYSAKYITGLNLTKLLKDTGFTGDALRTAFGVVMGESGGDRFGRNFNKAAASGGSRDNLDLGLFQINDLYNRSFTNEVGQTEQVDFGSKIFDAPYNSRLGFIYAKSRGWGDWNSWRDKTQAYQEGLSIFDRLPKYADGGHIQGPGGPREDLIPAMVSNGEYVVKAAAVKRVGVQFMNALNAGKYAFGGKVQNHRAEPLVTQGGGSGGNSSTSGHSADHPNAGGSNSNSGGGHSADHPNAGGSNSNSGGQGSGSLESSGNRGGGGNSSHSADHPNSGKDDYNEVRRRQGKIVSQGMKVGLGYKRSVQLAEKATHSNHYLTSIFGIDYHKEGLLPDTKTAAAANRQKYKSEHPEKIPYGKPWISTRNYGPAGERDTWSLQEFKDWLTRNRGGNAPVHGAGDWGTGRVDSAGEWGHGTPAGGDFGYEGFGIRRNYGISPGGLTSPYDLPYGVGIRRNSGIVPGGKDTLPPQGFGIKRNYGGVRDGLDPAVRDEYTKKAMEDLSTYENLQNLPGAKDDQRNDNYWRNKFRGRIGRDPVKERMGQLEQKRREWEDQNWFARANLLFHNPWDDELVRLRQQAYGQYNTEERRFRNSEFSGRMTVDQLSSMQNPDGTYMTDEQKRAYIKNLYGDKDNISPALAAKLAMQMHYRDRMNWRKGSSSAKTSHSTAKTSPSIIPESNKKPKITRNDTPSPGGGGTPSGGGGGSSSGGGGGSSSGGGGGSSSSSAGSSTTSSSSDTYGETDVTYYGAPTLMKGAGETKDVGMSNSALAKFIAKGLGVSGLKGHLLADALFALAMAESGGNNDLINKDRYGLWQLKKSRFGRSPSLGALLDPKNALSIVKRSGMIKDIWGLSNIKSSGAKFNWSDSDRSDDPAWIKENGKDFQKQYKKFMSEAMAGPIMDVSKPIGAPLPPEGQYAGLAKGGHVYGKGSPTSDSIIARLSNGEFVMSAAAVDMYGIDFMQMVNSGKMTPMMGKPRNLGNMPVGHESGSSFSNNNVEYNINVSVAGSNASPEEIAKTVLKTIKQNEKTKITHRNIG